MTTTLEETTIEAPAETSFADFIRTRREQRNVTDRRFSQRQLALRIGMHVVSAPGPPRVLWRRYLRS